MNDRTEQQKAIVARATEEFGKGGGADNPTTGALILYIQDLEAEVRALKQEADQNWRAAVGAMDEADNLYRESLNREY